MRYKFLTLIMVSMAALSGAAAQAPAQKPDPQRQVANCPPGVGHNAPTLGQGTNQNLSDKLADSNGIICPPAGVDPEIHVKPESGGAIEVIPPPGSPGGNPNIQPK